MRWCFFLSFIVSCLCVNLVIIGAQNLCPNKFEQICSKDRFQRFEGIFRRLSRSWQLGGLVPAFRLGWKRYFLPNFECFWSFSTMQMHAQACVRWLKNTTTRDVGRSWLVLPNTTDSKSRVHYLCLLFLEFSIRTVWFWVLSIGLHSALSKVNTRTHTRAHTHTEG